MSILKFKATAMQQNPYSDNCENPYSDNYDLDMVNKALGWKVSDRVYFVETANHSKFYFDTLIAQGIDEELLLASTGEFLIHAYIQPVLAGLSYHEYQAAYSESRNSDIGMKYMQMADAEWIEAIVHTFDAGVGYWKQYEHILTEMYIYNQAHEQQITLAKCLSAYLVFCKKHDNMDAILSYLFLKKDMTSEDKANLYDRAAKTILINAGKIWESYEPFMAWTARHDYFGYQSHEQSGGDPEEINARFENYSAIPMIKIWEHIDLPGDIKSTSKLAALAKMSEQLIYQDYDPAQDVDYFCRTKSIW